MIDVTDRFEVLDNQISREIGSKVELKKDTYWKSVRIPKQQKIYVGVTRYANGATGENLSTHLFYVDSDNIIIALGPQDKIVPWDKNGIFELNFPPNSVAVYATSSVKNSAGRINPIQVFKIVS